MQESQRRSYGIVLSPPPVQASCFSCRHGDEGLGPLCPLKLTGQGQRSSEEKDCEQHAQRGEQKRAQRYWLLCSTQTNKDALTPTEREE